MSRQSQGVLVAIDWREHGDVNVSVQRKPEQIDAGIDETPGRFVREMDRPEGRPNFVAYGMLGNQWMLYWGDRLERA